MVDDTGKSGSFDMGRVINLTVSALTVRFTATMGAYAVLALVVGMISRAWAISFTARFGANPGGLTGGLPASLTHVAISALVVLSLVLVVFRSALVQEIVGRLTGSPVSPSEAFRVGLRRFWPVIGIGLLAGLAVAVGMIFLLVPA